VRAFNFQSFDILLTLFIVKPKIIQRPNATEFGYRGHTKTLFFKVFAFPSATIEWRKNGIFIGRFRQEKSSLIVKIVQFKDSGIYQAIARNIVGEVRVTTFLAVTDPGK